MSRQARSDRSGAAEPTPWGDSPPQEWESLAPAVEPRPRAAESAPSGSAASEDLGSRAASAPRTSGADHRTARERSGADVRPAADERSGSVPSTAADHRHPAASQTDRAESAGPEGTEPGSSAHTAVPARPRARRLRQALIAVAVPLVTLMLGIRAAASSAFLWFEYHRPGFPEDLYGFGPEDRMVYGSHGLGYVTNLAPPRFLEDVVLPDGGHAFTVAEVSHMSDVKHVLLWATVAVLLVLVLALLGASGLRRKAPGAVRGALFVGAWLTVAVIVVLLVLAGLGWERFFIGFHEVFFPSGNWAFYPSDTLIRLFPDQFWVDAGVLVAVVVVLVVSVLLVSTWPLRFRRQRELGRRAALQNEQDEQDEQTGRRRDRAEGTRRA